MTTVFGPAKQSPDVYRQKALKSLDRLPPLAPSVGRLLSKLAFRGVNYGELAELVEKDALLCAHILRTVNSAAFGRSKTITSIKQAMTLLGISTLRRIAIGFTVSNLFTSSKTAASWSRMRFNLHSAATGILMETIVEAMPVENKDGAFVAGMLHDLGKLCIAVAMPDRYETISTMYTVAERPVFECERDILGVDHAELSAMALVKWGMPPAVCQAVAYHHDPCHKDAPWLAGVLFRADRFVNHLGISIQPAMTPNTDAPSIEFPGFEFDQAAVLTRFEKEWTQLSEFFGGAPAVKAVPKSVTAPK